MHIPISESFRDGELLCVSFPETNKMYEIKVTFKTDFNVPIILGCLCGAVGVDCSLVSIINDGVSESLPLSTCIGVADFFSMQGVTVFLGHFLPG